MSFQDETWKHIERWAQKKLEDSRVRNDANELDAIQTAALRGRISMLKELLALPKQQAAQAQMDEPQ